MAALEEGSPTLEPEIGWVKPIESSSTAAPTRPWQDRLTDLADLGSASLGSDSREVAVAPEIHFHLDAIESILSDPRPEITREIGRSRRSRNGSESAVLDATQVTEPGLDRHSDDPAKDQKLLPQLQSLLDEVSTFNRELNQRHEESIKIRDLFEENCRGLTRTVAELEDEVVELQSDLVEDAIELEGIQGTIRGLQHWIDGLREAQKQAHRTRLEQFNSRRWHIGKPNDQPSETDVEILLDGLGAWMRGWRDVEETFQIRAGARKSRRDRRKEQLSRPEIIDEIPRRLSTAAG